MGYFEEVVEIGNDLEVTRIKNWDGKVVKTYECPECGRVEKAKEWSDCGNKHLAVGMYQVLDWGKDGEPAEMKLNLGIKK